MAKKDKRLCKWKEDDLSNKLVTFKSYGTGKISPKHLEACNKKNSPGTV